MLPETFYRNTSSQMSRASDRSDTELKKLGLGSMIELMQHHGKQALIFMRSIRTPADAATARTPESEEGKMVKLVIPPQFEVKRLIDEARQMEMRANAGGLALGIEEREDLRRSATDLRVKAIALHLGIES